MEGRDLIDFLDQYDARHQGLQLDASPFRESDKEPPVWVQDRIPEWDRERSKPKRGVPYRDYDIDVIFDREGELVDRPDISSLAEDRELSDEEWRILIDEYVGAVSEEGFEAFAWYTTFHYTQRHWGISIREDGLRILTNLFFGLSRGRNPTITQQALSGSNISAEYPFDGEPISSRRDAAKLALEVLLRHEWMHYQVEVFATYLEDLYDTALYTQYMEDAYQANFAGEDCIEESVANAYVANSAAVRKFVPPGTFNDLFELSTLSQPEAYRKYDRFTGGDFKTGCRHLVHLIRNPGTENISNDIDDLEKQIAIGDQLPFDRDISQAIKQGRIPVNILKPEPERQEVYSYKAISLDDFYTNYEIIRSESFNKAYDKADGSIRDRISTQIEKLRESIHHTGFNWRPCKNGLSYLRINNQYRMIARRDDQARKITLIDFSTDHGLPKDYGCYTNT